MNNNFGFNLYKLGNNNVGNYSLMHSLTLCKSAMILTLFCCISAQGFAATSCPDPSNPGQTIPPILTSITAGVPDEFDTSLNNPEETVRSAELQAIIDNYATVNNNFINSRANRPFDVLSDNQFFGHTFSGLPANIIDASLEVRLKGATEIVDNDAIGLLDSTGSIGWNRSIKDLPEAGGTWLQNQDVVFNLNLQQLPNDSGDIDFLVNLNNDLALDVFVQDDTAVDYMTLNVASCPSDVDIAIDKQRLRTTSPPAPGSQVDYQVTVNNLGPGTATNIVVNDLLPADFVNITASVSGPPATYDSGTGKLNIPSLLPQEGVILSVNATLDNNLACGDIINTASLVSVDQTDTNSDNDQATDEFQLPPCVSCVDPVNSHVGTSGPPICQSCPHPLNSNESVKPTSRVILAGDEDNFGAVDTTTRSTNLATFISSNPNPDRQFDELGVNKIFGHTLFSLPSNIVTASLEILIQPQVDPLQFNDSLHLQYITPADSAWGHRIADLSRTNMGQNELIQLDLKNLPPFQQKDTNIIDEINSFGHLDVLIEDDTAVDYIKLTVQTCPAPVTQFPDDLVIGLATLRAGAGHLSSSLFDTSQDGHGLSMEVLDDNSALLTWYNYDQTGNQRWMLGVGSISGATVTANDMQIATGGIFGDNFDPSTVSRENWGYVTITFDSCDTASMQYESNDGTESGTLNLSRLTNLDGLKCELPANASTQALPTEAAKKSGTFFDPTHDGEGAVIQILENNSAVVYWYTYDQSGNQVWILGTGTFDGTTITVDNAITATGGILANFNPNDVVRETWGSFTITYSSCTQATLQYNSNIPEFGSGQQNLERLTTPKGLGC